LVSIEHRALHPKPFHTTVHSMPLIPKDNSALPGYGNQALFEARILAVVEECFRCYMLPLEYAALCNRFNRWASTRALDLLETVEGMLANQVLITTTLPSGRRFVWSMRNWNGMDEFSQRQACYNLAQLYIRKGSKRQRLALHNNVERGVEYPPIPTFFTKPPEGE